MSSGGRECTSLFTRFRANEHTGKERSDSEQHQLVQDGNEVSKIKLPRVERETTWKERDGARFMRQQC
jgi:hypothetical protein